MFYTTAMSWEAYNYIIIIVYYSMIIKCKMSKPCLDKVVFIILFVMNVLLEYFNKKFLYRYRDIENYFN